MKRLLFTLITVCFLLPGITFSATGKTRNPSLTDKLVVTSRAVPGQYIVVLNDGVPSGAIDSIAAQVASAYQGKVRYTFHNVFKGFSIEMSEEAALSVSRDSRVISIETNSLGTFESTGAGMQGPDCTSYGLDRIDQRDLPLNSVYNPPNGAPNVNVYVLDSGINALHPEFGGRASVAYDVLLPPDNPNYGKDQGGHGTGVAGIVGGATIGVAKQVRILAIRIGQFEPTADSIMKGLDWLMVNRQLPAVANLSVGVDDSPMVDQSVRRCISSGIVCVAAAGDFRSGVLPSPARVEEVITVGAVDAVDVITNSNVAPGIDIFAPGGQHVRTIFTDYRCLGETSAATPHVSGVVAMYLQNHPNATPAEVADKLNCAATLGKVTGYNGVTAPNRLLYCYLDVPSPTVNSFSPQSGAPGTAVIINGSNFTCDTRVKFNGVQADILPISSNSQVTAMVPEGATTGPLTVTTSAGTAQAGTFTVTSIPPTVSSFSPQSGVPGTPVIITGANFTSATKVFFNGLQAQVFPPSPNQVTAIVPQGATTGPLTVSTSAGTAPAGTFTVPLPPPTISSFAPSSGLPGTPVTITGSNFVPGATVKFAQNLQVPATFNSSTNLTAIVPPGAVTGTIGVFNSPTDFVFSIGVFVVPGSTRPVVTGFQPLSASPGTVVTIQGGSFTGATAVAFNGQPASFTFQTDSVITATVPQNATTGRISVTNQAGTGTSNTDFSVGPSISSFSPGSGAVGAPIQLMGLNFTSTTQVSFNGVQAQSVFNSSESITAYVPVNAVTGPISVTDGRLGFTTNTNFVVQQVAVSQFYPVASTTGKTITVFGSGFVAGNTQVFFGGARLIPAAGVNVVDSGTMQVTVPASGTGSANINGYLTIRVNGIDVTTEALPQNAPNPGNSASVFPEFVLWGDATGDGNFGTNDVTLARAFTQFQVVPTARQTLAVDVNPLNVNGSRGDGSLQANDITIMRAVLEGTLQF